MRRRDRALMRAEEPTLEQGDHAVHARQEFGRQLVLPSQRRDLMAIAVCFQPVVPVPPVGMDHAAWLDRLRHKSLKAVRGRIGDSVHPDPLDAAPTSAVATTISAFFAVDRPRERRPGHPRNFRRPPLAPTTDRGPAGPSRGAACAATPRRSRSFPAPIGAGAPRRWLAFSTGDPPHRVTSRSGFRVSWNTVPAVTEVWLPHAAHCQRPLAVSHAFARRTGSECRQASAAGTDTRGTPLSQTCFLELALLRSEIPSISATLLMGSLQSWKAQRSGIFEEEQRRRARMHRPSNAVRCSPRALLGKSPLHQSITVKSPEVSFRHRGQRLASWAAEV